MKKTSAAVAVLAVLGLSACQQEKADPMKVEQLKLETLEQQQAYGLGASLGQFVDQKLDMQEESDINLDRELVVKGFIAALQEQSQMQPQEIQEKLQALENSFQEKKRAKDVAAAEANKEEGAKFLAENAKKEGVQTTDSGLQYQIISEGEGEQPAEADTVKVHYKGTLIDGRQFDSSYDRGEPAVFPLNRVISGWTEGLQLMKVGSKFKFFIPSELAYGQRSTGIITPNSTLVFDVELLGIEGKGTEVK